MNATPRGAARPRSPVRPARRPPGPRVEALEERCLLAAAPFYAEPFLPVIDAATRGHLLAVYQLGQALGNRADAFARLGDSITASPAFLNDLGSAGYDPTSPAYAGAYTGLAPVVNYFRQTPVDVFGANSFTHASWGAYPGWRTEDVLNPDLNALLPDRSAYALPGETPFQMELRLTRPAVALIMFGTNDNTYDDDPVGFEYRLALIAQTALNEGVIPVLSTIPDDFSGGGLVEQRVPEYNQIITDVAAALDVPLWNYWLGMQPLPYKGISGDLIHPDVYPLGGGFFTADALLNGYNVRTLEALQVLEKLVRIVEQDGLADGQLPPGPPPAEVAAYVTGLYQTLLDRAPTAGEVSAWGQALAAGALSRQQLAQGIWDSGEHRALEVTQYYQTYLHRSPGPGEVGPWVNALLHGAGEEAVQVAILTSAEYTGAHLGAAQFVAGLYQDVLGRPADPAGLFEHEEALASGLSRAVVARSFLESAEKGTQVIDTDYAAFLGRAAGPADEEAWLTGLLLGDSLEAIGEGILASTEYWNLQQGP